MRCFKLRWLYLLLPSAFLELVSHLNGQPFSWLRFGGRGAFVALVLVAAHWLSRPLSFDRERYHVAALAGFSAWALLSPPLQHTWAAWLFVILWFAFLLHLDALLAAHHAVGKRMLWHVLLAALAAAFPLASGQLESHFADEEFFVVVQGVILFVLWGLLNAAWRQTHPRLPADYPAGRTWVTASLVLFATVGGVFTVRAYQRSFYPATSPTFSNISAQSPFLCGQVQPDPTTYEGETVFQNLLERVKQHPHKQAPEYGLLALATGEESWLQAFRQALLREAEDQRFTGPAHSVKSTQYEAALRAYYYHQIRHTYPSLFSPAEQQQIRAWFAQINRRALTVEWVDWLYALAFAKRPEGPYENQENGAGLLALLEAFDLAAPEYHQANQDYLARYRRGWLARFRVTDDALIYQPEWLLNAYFQWLYTRENNAHNQRLSFEWLLIQALPDGAPFGYNHPAVPSLAGIGYVAARWLKDPRFLWLAGRSAEALQRLGRPLAAWPGMEERLTMQGTSPTVGSCLLFGDSGLPNQPGPLAPDKIVLRDGWSPDSLYVLLNLRFTGWHRYKATGSVITIYQQGMLVGERLSSSVFQWLPEGRSLFRDKRIPRENLNGLLVGRTGMSAVLQYLTGVGSRWAQDPPYYAEVVQFETSDTMDQALVRLPSWRGWEAERWLALYHKGGPLVIVDYASGSGHNPAALTWQVNSTAPLQGNRITLRANPPAEMVLLPLEGNGTLEQQITTEGSRVMYFPGNKSHLALASVFLSGKWQGAQVSSQGNTLLIQRNGQVLRIALPWQITP